MFNLSWIWGLNCYISASFCPFWWRILDSLSFLGVFLYGRLFKTIPGDALPPWPRVCTIISYSTYIRSYWIILPTSSTNSHRMFPEKEPATIPPPPPYLQWHLQYSLLSWPNVGWGSCLTQKAANMGVFLWSIRNAKYKGGWRLTTICLTMSITRCKHHTPNFILCLNRYWHFTIKLWSCFKQCPLTMPEYRPSSSISWAWSIGAAASWISGANSMESTCLLSKIG